MTFISNNTHTYAFYVLYKEKEGMRGNFFVSKHLLWSCPCMCVKHNNFQWGGQSETIVRSISLIFLSYFHRPPFRIKSEYSYNLQYKLAKATISEFWRTTILIKTNVILFSCKAAHQRNLSQLINWEAHANISNMKTIPTSNSVTSERVV